MSADPESRSLVQQPSAASDETAVAPEEKLQGVSRRGFLRAGAGAAAVLMTTGPAAVLAEGHDHTHMAKEAPQSAKALALRAKAEAEWFEPFAEPSLMSLESTVPKSYNATLRVIMVPITFNDTLGKRTENVRTYNGEVPGPTFRVRAGDDLNVKVINDLPKNTDQFCGDHHTSMNNPHCFNTTNLHVHGLHVSPKEPSDNVFVEIPPKAEDPDHPEKGEYKFCFQLPLFHKPGTHWYHAHKHGSTAIQLVNGMAGALIVEDPPDKPLVPTPFADVVMIIQEIVAKAEDIYGCGPGQVPSVLFYVNGRYRPTINLIAGEMYRWRVINATSTPRGFTPLQLRMGATEYAMRLIAVDGIYLPSPRDEKSWLIAPGNRADYLVSFSSAGSYTLYKGAFEGPAKEQALAEIKVTATALKMAMAMAIETPPLPDYLRPFTDAEIKAALDAGKTRTVTFDVDTSTPNCAGRFQVNGKPFDPNGPAIEVNLGDTELWTIKNTSGASHPFHIHVNPFQVIDNNKKLIPAGERYWQDTVTVPGGGYVTFATRFLTFDGPFVLHCHILIHEDWGMMMKVTVKGNGYGPCVKVP